MRVIAGALKGRVFKAPDSKLTHPMSEKVRGAIFSSLGDISGLNFLDAYSGSGALSIEAISREAQHSTAIESNSKVATLITTNCKNLNIEDRVTIVKSKVESWLLGSEAKFDVVAVDPPYSDINVSALDGLSLKLNPGGVLVLSWPGKMLMPNVGRLKLIQQSSFGDAQLGFYKNYPL